MMTPSPAAERTASRASCPAATSLPLLRRSVIKVLVTPWLRGVVGVVVGDPNAQTLLLEVELPRRCREVTGCGGSGLRCHAELDGHADRGSRIHGVVPARDSKIEPVSLSIGKDPDISR